MVKDKRLTYGARSMRLTYVLKRTFNACFTYSKHTLHFLLCMSHTEGIEGYDDNEHGSVALNFHAYEFRFTTGMNRGNKNKEPSIAINPVPPEKNMVDRTSEESLLLLKQILLRTITSGSTLSINWNFDFNTLKMSATTLGVRSSVSPMGVEKNGGGRVVLLLVYEVRVRSSNPGLATAMPPCSSMLFISLYVPINNIKGF